MNVDALDTTRWDQYAEVEAPIICSQSIGMTTNDEVMVRMAVWWIKPARPTMKMTLECLMKKCSPRHSKS